MMSVPYVPMEMFFLIHYSIKTDFLVTITSAKRMDEIYQALIGKILPILTSMKMKYSFKFPA